MATNATQTTSTPDAPLLSTDDLDAGDEVVASAINEYDSEVAIRGEVKLVRDDYVRIGAGGFDVVVCPSTGRFYRSIASYRNGNDGIDLAGLDTYNVSWSVQAISTDPDLSIKESYGRRAVFGSRDVAEKAANRWAARTENQVFEIGPEVTSLPNWVNL